MTFNVVTDIHQGLVTGINSRGATADLDQAQRVELAVDGTQIAGLTQKLVSQGRFGTVRCMGVFREDLLSSGRQLHFGCG